MQIIGDPVTPGARILNVNGKTIFIQQADVKNGSQKWISYDEVMNVTAIKKLVTPNMQHLNTQDFREGSNSIIRIDQFIHEGDLQVGLFAFDADGNLFRSKEVQFDISERPLLPVPFYVIQSEDRKTFSLLQSIVHKDSLQLRTVVFDENLEIHNNFVFKAPFNPELFDFYLPLVTNNRKIALFLVEKFASYRLSSLVSCYYFPGDKKDYTTIELAISRKKLKHVQLFAEGDTIGLQANFSYTTERDKTAGIILAGVDLRAGQAFTPVELSYSASLGNEIKKSIAAEGRKGSFTNYLSIFPFRFQNTGKWLYGYLLPAQQPALEHDLGKSGPDIEKFQQIKTEIIGRQSLIGKQPPGFSKPMTPAEANAYASAYSIPQGQLTPGITYREPNIRKAKPKQKELICLIPSKKSLEAKILKIKSNSDNRYNFFAYYPKEEGYGVLYYNSPTFDQPAFTSASVNSEGELVQKKLFDDKNKVIVQDLPYLIRDGWFIGFFQDQLTREIGILKLPL